MNPYLQITLTFLTSFLISFLSIPSIIKVANLKHLFDEPESERKHHKNNVPTLGGLAIFAGFIFSTTFWAKQNEIVELQYIISSLIILFFMGVKDDIINLVAHKKLVGQAIAAFIVVYFADIRLTSLYGIFDIYDIPYSFSIILSLISVIAITNSFNLIDGIDTLAGSIGILSSTCFGIWFLLVGHYQYSIVSASITGALFAFLYYNKTPAKIFMGDTGSLVLGLISAVLAIKFIEFNKNFSGNRTYSIYSVPSVAISILIIPLFDTARVFILRILQGKSPLLPDRNHIHHILTDLNYSHKKSTLILLSINILLVALSYSLQLITRNGELILFINIIIMLIFSFYFSNKRRKKKDYKFLTFLFKIILFKSKKKPHFAK